MIISGKKKPVRPVYFLIFFLLILGALDSGIYIYSQQKKAQMRQDAVYYDILTSGIGLTDLCIATEARYTRHPAVSDLVVPFMDYPGAIEHFPTGSFWVPPETAIRPD